MSMQKQGGMGYVTAGETVDGTRVCFKVAKEGFEHVLEHEARMLKALEGAQIAPRLKDLGVSHSGELKVLPMEWLDGVSLSEAEPHIFAGRVALSGADVVALVREVLLCANAMHSRGIIHRDLHPGNILLLPCGTVKLIDFGCALFAGSKGVRSVVMNGRQPPETMCSSPKWTFAADVYTIASSFSQILPSVGRARGRDAHVLAMEDWMEACLQPAPRRRPQNASEALGLLNRACPLSERERQQCSIRRRTLVDAVQALSPDERRIS